MTDEINDFLFGGGTPAAPLKEVGDRVSGTVIRAVKAQSTDLDGNLRTFPESGDPMFELHVDLQTDLRDPEIDSDKGERRLYVRGGNYEVQSGSGESMKDAIAGALKKIEAKNFEGIKLTVAHSGLSVPSKGRQPARLYVAKAERVVETSAEAIDDLLG